CATRPRDRARVAGRPPRRTRAIADRAGSRVVSAVARTTPRSADRRSRLLAPSFGGGALLRRSQRLPRPALRAAPSLRASAFGRPGGAHFGGEVDCVAKVM